jgi:hypothetical protein
MFAAKMLKSDILFCRAGGRSTFAAFQELPSALAQEL